MTHTIDFGGEKDRHGVGTRHWTISGETCPALAPRGVILAGCTQMGAGYEVVRNRPTFAHVGVCCGGHPEYLIDGQWRRVDPGVVLLAPQGVPHGSRATSARTRGRIAWVLFDPARPHAGRTESWNTGAARLLGPRDHRPLWWALQGLYVESSGAADPATLGQWIDLVITITSRLAFADHPRGSENLRLLWESVDADLKHPWTIDEMADRAGLSVTHFRRLCRKQFGDSPLKNLTRLRMQRAATMLLTTEHKLRSIATAVGYENVFAFSVAFKRWSQQSPGSWRK
jgi:AraC-like DNA-binding protein